MSVQSLPCPVQGCPETLPATEISLHLGEAHNALDSNDRLSLFRKAMAPQAFKARAAEQKPPTVSESTPGAEKEDP